MSWLSRIVLPHDLLDDDTELLTANFYHKLVWSCFRRDKKACRDFLFRVYRQEKEVSILILSPDRALCPQLCRPEKFTCKEIAPSFLQYDSYVFDLLANPTRKVGSRHIAIENKEEQKAWFFMKAKKAGFELHSSFGLSLSAPRWQIFEHGKDQISQIGVRFRGILHVTERNAFIQAFHLGIGTGKSFGFGLLFLEPIG